MKLAAKRKAKSASRRKTTKKTTRRKTTRKAKPKARSKTKAKSKSKSKAKSKSKKKAFGGYAINFAGRQETVEQVFGKKPVAPSEMTKKIWAFVKSKKLATK